MSHENKFAYFGTPAVARDTLEALIAGGFTPATVVTAPDAPRGRGLSIEPSETGVFARAHALPVITPPVLDAETINAIRSMDCSYALVVAYGKIFPEELIRAFPSGVLNVHYSLLPKYRGATPLEGALLAGEKETGVTIQAMVKELDAGAIIAQKAIAIEPCETARELRPRLVALGAQLLIETLPRYLEESLAPQPQDHAHASHTHKIKKEDGLIDRAAPPEKNWNTYRAYTDTIGTYFFHNGKRIKITDASFENGAFVIKRVIPEGKREMAYTETKP